MRDFIGEFLSRCDVEDNARYNSAVADMKRPAPAEPKVVKEPVAKEGRNCCLPDKGDLVCDDCMKCIPF